jgi:hypothetical protein
VESLLYIGSTLILLPLLRTKVPFHTWQLVPFFHFATLLGELRPEKLRARTRNNSFTMGPKDHTKHAVSTPLSTSLLLARAGAEGLDPGQKGGAWEGGMGSRQIESKAKAEKFTDCTSYAIPSPPLALPCCFLPSLDSAPCVDRYLPGLELYICCLPM